MKLPKIRLHSIILALVFILIGFSIATFAWTENLYAYPFNLMGESVKAYFATGDGSDTDTFIISERVHFFNFSYLQNAGVFDDANTDNTDPTDTKFYFKVAEYTDGVVGGSTTIDFNGSNDDISDLYSQIAPVGTITHPFMGEFDGYNSTLKDLVIDGTGCQDIGLFGFIGATDETHKAYIHDLFLDNINIISNPASTIDSTNFHPHNDGQHNIATGYVAGHIVDYSSLESVFVLSSKISSLSNEFDNRSQYGLIGYSTADLGTIAGGPEDSAYDFRLDADDAYFELSGYTLDTYGGYYVNGSSLTLSEVMIKDPNLTKLLTIIDGYSISSIKISATQYGEQIYLYDQLVADNHKIGTESTGYYSRENIDVASETVFAYENVSGQHYFSVAENAGVIVTPLADEIFDPIDYPQTMVLYVQPTSNAANLGTVIVNFTGAQGLAFYVGNLTDSRHPTKQAIGTSGISYTLSISELFCQVQQDPSTGEMTVVNSDPDFYVFLIGGVNGQSKVRDVDFSYTPQALNTDSLASISNVDFINEADVVNIKASNPHTISYVNFGYSLIGNQGIEIVTMKEIDGTFSLTIDTSIIDSTFVSLNILNIDNYYISVYFAGNSTAVYYDNYAIVEVTIDSTGVSAVGHALGS